MEVLGPIICVLFFAVTLLAAIGLSVSLIGRARSNRRHLAHRKIAQIAQDFPDEVRAWGGAEALRDLHTVRAIIAKLEGR